MIDPFGLKEKPEPESRESDVPGQTPPGNRKRLWAVLLLLDTIFLIIFGGTIARIALSNGGPAKLLGQIFTEPPPAMAVPNRVIRTKRTEPVAPAAVPVSSATALTTAPTLPPAKSTAPAAGVQPAPADPKKARPVEFICGPERAKEVYLKGSFLVHSKNGMKRMKKGGDGAWHLSVMLLPGTYKYQCVANGKKSAFKPKRVE